MKYRITIKNNATEEVLVDKAGEVVLTDEAAEAMRPFEEALEEANKVLDALIRAGLSARLMTGRRTLQN